LAVRRSNLLSCHEIASRKDARNDVGLSGYDAAVSDLRTIAEASEPNEWMNRVDYLPL